MRVHRPFIILPVREPVPDDGTEAHASYMRLVPHACEACAQLTAHGMLCNDCEDRTRPHEPGDPYDVLGGDHGAE
jgi:hypothetical protein